MVFIPTYLYIKRHLVTGKLYFGKTIKNPETYYGSGKHWTLHYKKHGKEHIETLWYCLFYDKESIQEFALNFSKQETITESDQWLNLKDEDGLSGGWSKNVPGPNNGKIWTIESKSKQSNSQSIKDKITAKDLNGTTFVTSKSDPRWLTGEIGGAKSYMYKLTLPDNSSFITRRLKTLFCTLGFTPTRNIVKLAINESAMLFETSKKVHKYKIIDGCLLTRLA
jgi:hypothetical protein